jgi:hypothetical protein
MCACASLGFVETHKHEAEGAFLRFELLTALAFTLRIWQSGTRTRGGTQHNTNWQNQRVRACVCVCPFLAAAGTWVAWCV